MAELVPVQRKFDLPKKSTADSLAEMVRAILGQDAVVRKMVLTAEPPVIEVDMLVPNREPPFGEVETDDPTDIWQAIQAVDLEEVEKGEGARLNVGAIAQLTVMMVRASEKKMAGVGVVTGSVVNFMRWLGVDVREDHVPTMFWNMPLIQLPALPDDKCVLLCAKSARLGPLKATVGYVAQMFEEADSVGQSE